MESNNVHTSVVIELGNQEEPNEQNRFKIDFGDADQPKDYVIDQIFCGENITVYALFEISDVTKVSTRKSDKHLVEVKNSTSAEEFRFYHKNSYQKTVNETRKMNITVMNSEENAEFLSGKNRRNESFYCLKHYGGSYEVSSLEDDSRDMKVLFQNSISNDVVSQTSKTTKLKAVSRGVNTDIGQCPKLLEEVQRVVNLNFSFGNPDGKETQIITSFDAGQPYDVLEVEAQQSCSSFESGLEIKYAAKSSPNFVLVPLLLLEEGMLKHFRKDETKNPKPTTEKSVSGKNPRKISMGINTDLCEFSTFVRKDVHSKTQPNDCFKSEQPPATEQPKPQFLFKETLLEEIKFLQWKLNALIKSMESNNFEFGTGDALKENPLAYSAQTKIKIQESSGEPVLETEPMRRMQSKFDELPIFSPLNFNPLPGKVPNQRLKKKPEKKEMVLGSKSTTSVISISGTLSSLTQSFFQERTSPDLLKEKEDFLGWDENVSISKNPKKIPLNWTEFGSRRGAGSSRSESHVRCIFPEVRYTYAILKKSLSFEGRESKMDAFVVKKIKPTVFKLEGTVRIHQRSETFLGDNLGLANCKMGDDAGKKPKISAGDLLNLQQTTEKTKKENDKKNEGDGKSTKKSSVPIYNQEKSFCVPTTEGGLKTERCTTPKGGRKAEKNSEKGTKAISSPEKTTTIVRNVKKLTKTEGKLFKGASSKNKTTELPTKSDKKEDPSKSRAVSGCRKTSTKSSAESKLHVDKLLRKPNESDGGISPKSPKSGNSRPPSQKKDRREAAMPAAPTKTTSGDNDTNISAKNSTVAIQQPNKTKPKENPQEPDPKPEKPPKEPEEDLTPVAKISPNPSSVVFEIFSEKPRSVDNFYSEIDQDGTDLENCGNACENGQNGGKDSETESSDKPIVKSVWALTKVLLYEDGTKKFEVLEATSSPPGYSLKIVNDNPTEEKQPS